MGNPRFLRVLAVEWVLGCTAKTIAEVQARGSKVWEELDFLASDLSLEARLPCLRLARVRMPAEDQPCEQLLHSMALAW